MLKKYQQGKIPNSLKRYINMCEKAKDILDSNHYFEKHEFFFHPYIGISIVDKNLGNGYLYCTEKNSYLSNAKIKSSECIWLPSVNNLKDLGNDLNLTEECLNNFLNDDKGYGYLKGKKPSEIFNLPEEKWLAYYMLERHNMIWSQKEKEWKKSNFFNS